MKKLLVLSLAGLAALTSLGQGMMQFTSLWPGEFMAPVFGPDPQNPWLELHGQPLPSSVDGQFDNVVILPAGTVVYGGSLLQGTGYTLQLWTGDSPENLAPALTTSFRTATANKLPAGLVSITPIVTFANVDAGARGWYQVRVWDNRGGTVNTWGDAYFDAIACSLAAGWSEVVQSQPLGGLDATGGMHLTPFSEEWSSFNIHYFQAPEPGALALMGLGLALMVLRRARR
jgi:hypothetical protein